MQNMICSYSRLQALIAIFLSLLILANCEILSWYINHQICSAEINSQKLDIVTNRMNYTCRDSAYLTYMRNAILQKNVISEYFSSLFQAVIDMYADLEEARKPRMLSLDAHPKKLKLGETYSRNVILIHPISFCIPEENIVKTVPPKIKPFGRVIPGLPATYFHLWNETQYFEDMEQSLFAITFKKGGWDCLRHLEILASGSLPLFLNLRNCPHQTLTAHPKKVYQILLEFPGLNIQATRTGLHTMDVNKLELSPPELNTVGRQAYTAVASALLQYTRNVLSTRAMAAYVMETMRSYSKGYIPNTNPKLILYLTHQDHDMDKGDYMTDFLLHGLKAVYGDEAVVDFPRRDGLYKTSAEFNRSDYLTRRAQLYGGGFSWGLKIDDLLGELPDKSKQTAYVQSRDSDAVRRGLVDGRFDIVILGSGHRDGWASKLHFWDLVCKHYHPLRVGFVDGSDKHLPKKLLERYSPCAGHIFSREGYVD